MSFISSFARETEIVDWSFNGGDFPTGPQTKTYPRLRRHGLPGPKAVPGCSYNDVLASRCSAQGFSGTDISSLDLSRLLASVGLRRELSGQIEGRRTYPSAGARYPVEVYVLSLRTEGLLRGVYHYAPREHELEELWLQDLGGELVRASNDVRIEGAGLVFVLTTMFSRVTSKYGQRGVRYALIEVGHMAQNVCLMAAALDHACYEVGGFIDRHVNDWLDIDGESEAAALMIAVGGAVR